MLDYLIAYIDPGSGTFLLQVIIATGLSSLLFFRGLWSSFLGLFAGRKRDDANSDD